MLGMGICAVEVLPAILAQMATPVPTPLHCDMELRPGDPTQTCPIAPGTRSAPRQEVCPARRRGECCRTRDWSMDISQLADAAVSGATLEQRIIGVVRQFIDLKNYYFFFVFVILWNSSFKNIICSDLILNIYSLLLSSVILLAFL